MSQDALVDLSGAIGETVKLNDKQLNKELLWERMLLSNDLEFGPLLCAGISVCDLMLNGTVDPLMMFLNESWMRWTVTDVVANTTFIIVY